MGAAMKGMGTGFKREFIKHSTGYFATGRNALRWKLRHSDCCPRCLQPDENAAHVIQCSCEKSDALWDENMRDLEAHFADLDTWPVLQGVIISRLNAWRYQKSQMVPFTNAPQSVQRIVSMQDAAGWQCAFEGRWVKGWTGLQANHYRRIGSMRSSKQWLAKTIRKIWEISWSMWKLWNSVLHDEQKGLQREQLRIQISEQFQLGFSGFSPKVDCLTSLTIEDVLSRTSSYQKLWLRRINVYHSECDRQSTAVLNQRLRASAIRCLRKRCSDGSLILPTPGSEQNITQNNP
jgi:hypothetical protein